MVCFQQLPRAAVFLGLENLPLSLPIPSPSPSLSLPTPRSALSGSSVCSIPKPKRRLTRNHELLISDGYFRTGLGRIRASKSWSLFCKQYHPLSPPLHTTYKLQPYNVGVFAPRVAFEGGKYCPWLRGMWSEEQAQLRATQTSMSTNHFPGQRQLGQTPDKCCEAVTRNTCRIHKKHQVVFQFHL